MSSTVPRSPIRAKLSCTRKHRHSVTPATSIVHPHTQTHNTLQASAAAAAATATPQHTRQSPRRDRTARRGENVPPQPTSPNQYHCHMRGSAKRWHAVTCEEAARAAAARQPISPPRGGGHFGTSHAPRGALEAAPWRARRAVRARRRLPAPQHPPHPLRQAAAQRHRRRRC